MRTLSRFATLVAVLALAPAWEAPAEPTTATLTLDGLSFVSFGNQQVLPIPAGSSIRFAFGETAPDGTTPFVIEPGDAAILPIPMSGDYQELRYSLASPAAGTMRETPEGRRLDFTASLLARLVSPTGEVGPAATYSVPFTTETAQAHDLAGNLELEVTGMRLVDGIWYVQLVGGVTNRAEAFPEPGTAVYTVLSGSFDRVP